MYVLSIDTKNALSGRILNDLYLVYSSSLSEVVNKCFTSIRDILANKIPRKDKNEKY